MRRNIVSPAAALLAALCIAAPATAQSRRVEARTPAAADARVEISALGTLRISGWARNEVQVTGTASNAGDRVVFDGSRGSVEVSLRGPRGRAAPGTFEIRVPAGSSVEVSGGAGSITIAGVSGAVEASSHGGGVTVSGSPRSVEISTAGGSVVVNAETNTLEVSTMGGGVQVGGTVRQRAEISTLGGPVVISGTVAQAEVSAVGGGVRIANATGRIEVSAVDGDVEVRGSGLRGEVNNVSGRVTVIATGALGGPLSLNSHGGDVELRLAPRVGATINVTAFRGSVVSELGGARRESGRERQVVVGGGGPTVSIDTFSGQVRLTRP